MKKSRLTVVWLIPAEPERELFREIIRILASGFNAPRFEPHLTLGPAKDACSPPALLRDLRIPPLKLRIRGIAFSAKFTKTLFIRFEPNRDLQRVAGLAGKDRKSLRDPHLSLIYKKLPAATKREMAWTIKLPFRYLMFDVLQIMNCASPTETSRDVENWRMLGRKRLSG